MRIQGPETSLPWQPRGVDPAERETAATYEQIADAYQARQLRDEWQSQWLSVLMARLVPLVAPRMPSSAAEPLALDLGCGPGVHLPRLAELGFRPFGLDRSAAMLSLARAAGHTVVRADLRALPLQDGVAAAAWSSFALLHLAPADLARAFSEIARVLAPGGAAALTFAGGELSYREPVSYSPVLHRTYHPVSASQVTQLAREAGLTMVDQGADPGASRGAHWAMLARR